MISIFYVFLVRFLYPPLITRIMPLIRISRACRVPILLTPVCAGGAPIANWKEGIRGSTRRFDEIQSAEKNNIKEPERE